MHGLVLSLRDVTERNAVTRALQESRRRLEAVLDIAGAAIYVTDLDGACVLANRRANDLAGVAGLVARHSASVFAAGCALQFDDVVDGRYLLSAIVPVTDFDGVATGLCAVVTDITDRVHAQAETEELQTALERAQRMDSLGQLAGGIAHDFNNLLAVILNYTDFVAETLEDGHPAAADVAEISRATERAASLTRQLLVFSRHDHLRLEPVDVNEVALATQRLLARTLGKDVELTVAPAPRAVRALADSGQLEQVLVNLVLNARDALPRGGHVHVAVSEVVLDSVGAERRGVRPGRHVRVVVRDNGEGMSAAVAERAFEPFFTTKPKGRGTGLGLSTVYGIVTNAEGHIAIESRPQEGTTVTMHLPIVDASSPAPDAADVSIDASGGATIMVVEDEDAIRTLTHRILTRHGYRVVDVRDAGRRALRLRRSGRPAADRRRHARDVRQGAHRPAAGGPAGPAGPVHLRLHGQRDGPLRARRGRRHARAQAVQRAAAAGGRAGRAGLSLRVCGRGAGPAELPPGQARGRRSRSPLRATVAAVALCWRATSGVVHVPPRTVARMASGDHRPAGRSCG